MKRFISNFTGDYKHNNLIRTRLDLVQIRDHADELFNYQFSFIRPWDMESCRISYDNSKLDWNLVANGDEEWTFMLNRFDYLQSVVLTYIKTGREEYRDWAINLILDWIEKHPVILPGLSTRTLDTAIRIDAWIHAIEIISNESATPNDFLEKVGNSILLQMQYLKDNYLPKYTLSNWGSIQTMVIIRTLPLFYDNYEDLELYQWALQEFRHQIQIQVYDDGLFWEQSTMYHVEFLKNLIKLPNDVLTAFDKEVIRKMSLGLAHLSTSALITEAFGDSDRTHIQDILSYASVVLCDPSLKPDNELVMDSERLYEMSKWDIQKYEAMTSTFSPALYFDGFDSGMHTIRSSWKKDGNFLLYTNGSLGSGHGHADNQHLSLYHNGKAVLVDGGRYSYREDLELRKALKSQSHHNGLIVDDYESAKPSGSWTFDNFHHVLKNYANHKGEFHFIQGTTYDERGLIHTRKILHNNEGLTLLVDNIFLEGNHGATLNFNLDDKIVPQLKGSEVNLDVVKLVVDPQVNIEIKDSSQSVLYNQVSQNKRVVAKFKFEERAQIYTWILPIDSTIEQVEIIQNGNTLVDDEVGKAFKINNDYTFIVINQEIYKGGKIMSCQGVSFHAKALVIDHRGDNDELVVLST